MYATCICNISMERSYSTPASMMAVRGLGRICVVAMAIRNIFFIIIYHSLRQPQRSCPNLLQSTLKLLHRPFHRHIAHDGGISIHPDLSFFKCINFGCHGNHFTTLKWLSWQQNDTCGRIHTICLTVKVL